MHAYLGGIVKGLNGVPLAIGGIEDHVHLLVGLTTGQRVDYFTRDVKADSSAWVHKEIKTKLFAWQKDMACFRLVHPISKVLRNIFLLRKNIINGNLFRTNTSNY